LYRFNGDKQPWIIINFIILINDFLNYIEIIYF
jgi:hypothetical protein